MKKQFSLFTAAFGCTAALIVPAAPLLASTPQVQGYEATNPRGAPVFSAPPGAPVLIRGVNLGRAGTITFNGVPAPAVAEWSSTEVVVTVPAAPFYPYRGPVTLAANQQIAFGSDFTITPPSGPAATPPPAGPTPESRKIQITNLADGETVRYPVGLLRGLVEGGGTSLVTVTNTSSNRSDRVTSSASYQGRFNALERLTKPNNDVIGFGYGEAVGFR